MASLNRVKFWISAWWNSGLDLPHKAVTLARKARNSDMISSMLKPASKRSIPWSTEALFILLPGAIPLDLSDCSRLV